MTVARAVALTVLFVVLTFRTTPAQAPVEHPRVAQALELARIRLEAQRAYDQIPVDQRGAGASIAPPGLFMEVE